MSFGARVVEQLFISVISAGIAAAVVSVLVVLKIQHMRLIKLRASCTAWEQQQKRDQQLWESQHEKHLLYLNAYLMASLLQLREAWEAWKKKDAMRIETHVQQYRMTLTQIQQEYELRRIPRTDEVPITDEGRD